ncbi:MFS transporter, DHA1 family, arabinose polymer transporter [Reichenbachiella agariperforans]|uniref:MFS transporter, DHA1 family, arabinose polymer transporter n=1 Tax=Reichenbachiella agariperforans TaxID=156994 RepID=A0A1M6R793_REIAG|nr:MFS transporter [Reichenbachiella agariperforans]SHK28296.1 MFS transporter, DHA1 family, arabinose polymer transporter [Reichenbachiella agariperforans]
MNKGLLTLAIGGFGIGMTEFVMMGILPDVAQALDVTIPQAGHFISAYALGVVVGAPLFSALGGRWSSNTVLMMLMAWFAVFNTLSSLAYSYETLMLARFLSGMPHGAFFGIGAVVAGQICRPGKSAQAIAIMFGGLTVANLIGVPIGTYLGHSFHWSIAFVITGAIGLVALASIKFWMPVMPKSSSAGFSEDLKLFKNPELWAVILLTTIGTGGLFCWYSYIAPLITEVAGHPDYVVSYAMTLAGLGMVIGNVLGAKLVDYFSPIHSVIISFTTMATLLIVNVYLAHDPTLILVMTFVIGVVAFTVGTPIQMVMINTAKGSEVLGSSLNQSAFNMGNASGAYFAGLPIAMGYGFTSADVVGAIMAGSGVVIAFGIILMRRSRAKKEARVSQ